MFRTPLCCVLFRYNECFIVSGGKPSKEIKKEEDSVALQACHETPEATVGKSPGAATDGTTKSPASQHSPEDMSLTADPPISRKRIRLSSEVKKINLLSIIYHL